MTTGFPPKPTYPLKIDSDRTLFLVFNTSEAKLTKTNSAWSEEIEIEPIGANKDEIWANNGFANISGELFYYDAVDKNSNGKVFKLKRCARNLGGKKTKFNNVGTWVRGYVIAEHHNQIVDATINVENYIFEIEDEIIKLEEQPICIDDIKCPEIILEIERVNENQEDCEGILINYTIIINGEYNSFTLNFGDGESTNSTTSGSHLYSSEESIDPIVIVSSPICSVLQTPSIRTPDRIPEFPPPPEDTFCIKIPPPPIFPTINIPNCPDPDNFDIPQIIIPTIDIVPSTGINVIINTDPDLTFPNVNVTPINGNFIFNFGPAPEVNFNANVNFGPAPDVDFNANINFGPAPDINFNANINFGPAPFVNFNANVNFGPAPDVDFNAKVEFGPAPDVDFNANVNFGPAPDVNFNANVNFGPAPVVNFNANVNFGPAPDVNFNANVNFGPAPSVDFNANIEFGPAPDVDFNASFNWGNPPSLDFDFNFNWGNPPSVPTGTFDWKTPPQATGYFIWGTPPTVPSSSFTWGPTPNGPRGSFDWGSPPSCDCTVSYEPLDCSGCVISFEDPPTISVSWGSPPTIQVSISCPSGSNTPFRNNDIDLSKLDLDDDFVDNLDDPINVKLSGEDLGIPSEIRIVAPKFPDIKVNHDIPKSIEVNSKLPSRIELYQENPIIHAHEIKIINDTLPKTIQIEAGNVPKSIYLDSSNLPNSINLVVPEFSSIKVDASSIPETIKVVGIPDSIEVKMPNEITARLEIPDNIEIPLVYKGSPIPIQFDNSNLFGSDENPCFKLIPCDPKK